MATLGGGGRGREGGEEQDNSSSGSKRPRVISIISLVDSSDDEDEAGGSSKGSAEAAAPALEGGSGSIGVGNAAVGAANPSTIASRADLPILPFYLGRVEHLADEYNAQCLGIEDVIAGEYEKAILVRVFVCRCMCVYRSASTPAHSHLIEHAHVHMAEQLHVRVGLDPGQVPPPPGGALPGLLR